MLARNLAGMAVSLVVILGVSLGAGCGSCGESEPRQKQSTSQQQKRSDAGVPTRLKTVHLPIRPDQAGQAREAKPRPPVPRQVSFVLLDPGKGRRQLLRYRPDEQARAFRIQASIKTREHDGNGWQPELTLPRIGYGLSIQRAAQGTTFTVQGLAPEIAEAEWERAAKGAQGGKNGKAGSAPQAADPARIKQAVDDFLARFRAHLEGRRATVTLDERGLLGAVVLPDDQAKKDQGDDQAKKDQAQPRAVPTRQEIQQLLLESVVPLPQEPVGKGARWRVTTVLRRAAGLVTQVADYELVEARPDRLRIEATLVQYAEHQMAQVAELPAGTVAELVALLWRATGEVQISPRSLTPMAAKLAMEYRVHGRLVGPSGGMDHFLESTGTVELTSAAP